MTICWDLNLSNILFDGDCQVIVKAVNRSKTSDDELNLIVHDTRFMLHRASGWQVRFVYRESNGVAHSLAKLVLSCIGDQISMEDCPNPVLNMVLGEKVFTGLHLELIYSYFHLKKKIIASNY